MVKPLYHHETPGRILVMSHLPYQNNTWGKQSAFQICIVTIELEGVTAFMECSNKTLHALYFLLCHLAELQNYPFAFYFTKSEFYDCH